MFKVLLSGCGGAMGKMIAECASGAEDCEIVAGLDIAPCDAPFPVFTSIESVNVDFDVIIDFSHVSALDNVLKLALSKGKPAVIATTGFSEVQRASILLASAQIPIFFTANMSLGVSLVCELAQKAAAVLGGSFDIEIVEAHHHRKLDAPSGTALMIADAISESLDYEPEYEYDRHSKHEKRSKDEIGIHSIRGGTIVGEHEVIFAGDDEVIKIFHSASSRKIFANGSINAARFISKKAPGLYSMKELVSEM